MRINPVPKVCSTSIRYAFRDEVDPADPDEVHKAVNNALKRTERSDIPSQYDVFAFVRNPFDRIVSCYLNVVKKEPLLRGWYGPFAYISDSETFESFVHKICKVPDMFADRHFRSQHKILYAKNKPLFTMLGHYETFNQDFAHIQKTFHLLDIPHKRNMKKGDWRLYYTPRLAKKIYKRYKKDFLLLGYNDSYVALLDFLKESEK
jgi:hypothetical protein